MPADGHRHRPPPKRETSGSIWGLLALFCFAVAIGLFMWKMADPISPSVGALLMLGPVIGFCVVLISRVTDRQYDIRSIMYLGLATRLIGTFYRFQFPADATTYHIEGMRLAERFRALDFLADTQRQIPGTGAVRYVSGLVHLFAFDDLSATFVFWLLFSFTGTWLLYRAFAIGMPNGDRYRYALLLFLWPSLSYWPSSIGKEGWMLLGIGLSSYGAALAFKRSMRLGIPIFVSGLVVCGLVRPHVGLIMVIALAFALLLRRRTPNKAVLGAKIVGLTILLVGGAVLAGQTATLLKTDDPLGNAELTGALDSTSVRTTQGDSAFEPSTVHSPIDYPKALVTVLFRPLPNEAHDINGLLTSAETLFLLFLFAISAKRLWQLPKLIRDEPYVTYALIYVLTFVYAFSAVGNFGILARQRSQLTPLLLVLVCLPPTKAKLPRFGRRRRLAMEDARKHHAVERLDDDGRTLIDLEDVEGWRRPPPRPPLRAETLDNLVALAVLTESSELAESTDPGPGEPESGEPPVPVDPTPRSPQSGDTDHAHRSRPHRNRPSRRRPRR